MMIIETNNALCIVQLSSNTGACQEDVICLQSKQPKQERWLVDLTKPVLKYGVKTKQTRKQDRRN